MAPNTSPRSSRIGALALALTMTVVAGTRVSAHRLDEYLQAARIDLRTDGVAIELDLTPGVTVAESIIAMIDHDGNGSMSTAEQQAYAEGVVRALQIELDREPLRLQLVSSTFPDVSAFRRGEGMIRLRASAAHRSLSAGGHQLLFRNVHLGHQSAYLANALVPESARVAVTGQRRDEGQRELTIDYSVSAGSPLARIWFAVIVTAAASMIVFRRRADRRSPAARAFEQHEICLVLSARDQQPSAR